MSGCSRCWNRPPRPPPLSGTDTYVGGVAEGRLLGGNLSVLSRVIGTPYMPLLEDTVLLLEDQGERPYRLDRMWTHLELAGVFRRIRGIVLGSFTQCEEPGAPYSQRRRCCASWPSPAACRAPRASPSDTARTTSRCPSGCACGSRPTRSA